MLCVLHPSFLSLIRGETTAKIIVHKCAITSSSSFISFHHLSLVLFGRFIFHLWAIKCNSSHPLIFYVWLRKLDFLFRDHFSLSPRVYSFDVFLRFGVSPLLKTLSFSFESERERLSLDGICYAKRIHSKKRVSSPFGLRWRARLSVCERPSLSLTGHRVWKRL